MPNESKDKRKTETAEELALVNSLALSALVELLEEKRILRRSEVLQRMRLIRTRKQEPAVIGLAALTKRL